MPKLISTILVLLAAFAAEAVTCTWTGNGGDYKWSTAANWDALAAPADGDNVVLLGRRDVVLDTTPIINGIPGLTLNQLKFGNQVSAATTNITLFGEAITLKRTIGSDYPLVKDEKGLAFKAGTSGFTFFAR